MLMHEEHGLPYTLARIKPPLCHVTRLMWLQVWRGSLWGKAVAIKLLPLVGVDDRQLDCLRREVAVLLHTTGECKQVGRGMPGITAMAVYAELLVRVRPEAERCYRSWHPGKMRSAAALLSFV